MMILIFCPAFAMISFGSTSRDLKILSLVEGPIMPSAIQRLSVVYSGDPRCNRLPPSWGASREGFFRRRLSSGECRLTRLPIEPLTISRKSLLSSKPRSESLSPP